VIPARWDVPAGEQLGTVPLPPEPGRHGLLAFQSELTACAAKVVARSGGGPIYFPGRSCDSVRDALKVWLADTGLADAPRLLPFSISGLDRLTPAEVRQWRINVAAHGLTPAALARARHQIALCDLVWAGRTSAFFFGALRAWADDEREPWSVIRRKLRFVGIVKQAKSSPNTWRWNQAATWTEQLPHSQVSSVVVPIPVWSYLGDQQTKLTRPFTRHRWFDVEGAEQRERTEPTRRALAEAESWVRYLWSLQAKHAFIKELTEQREVREPWLRALMSELRGTDARRAGLRVNASRLPSFRR